MRTYRRVLALVALNAEAEAVASRALQLARFHGAALAIATIVDYTPGFECDHAPFATAAQMKRAIVEDVADKLDGLSRKTGATGAEIIVAGGRDIVEAWYPDLVVVSARAPYDLEGGRKPPYDVLVVQNGRRSYPGRLIDALAGAF